MLSMLNNPRHPIHQQSNNENKLNAALQTFLVNCMMKSAAMWEVDIRRRFSANLLTKTRNKTNDFKVYQECFHTIVKYVILQLSSTFNFIYQSNQRK